MTSGKRSPCGWGGANSVTLPCVVCGMRAGAFCQMAVMFYINNKDASAEAGLADFQSRSVAWVAGYKRALRAARRGRR